MSETRRVELEAADEQSAAERTDFEGERAHIEAQAALAQRDERITELETRQSASATDQGKLEALLAEREDRCADLERDVQQTREASP